MIKVGITGGIGSGKSVVCSVFSKLGVSVYDADSRAKYLINTHPGIREKMVAKFGESIFRDNQIDRGMLSKIIFSDTTALAYVNSVVHPIVGSDFDEWASKRNNEHYILKEAALLYESGAYLQLDNVVTVYAPKEIRLNRAMTRDNASLEQIEDRMKNQISDDEKVKRADYIIYNFGNHSVLQQVLQLHALFISKDSL